jgi:HPt (histidine-containing phosphotransfer) domain-containing protein
MDKQKLMAAGIDVEGGINRLMGNEEMYENFLQMFIKDDSFQKLEQAMQAEDYKEAFAQAHTLKGVAGNLSMQRLYETLVPFVDQLRNGVDIPGAVKEFPNVKKLYDETISAIC